MKLTGITVVGGPDGTSPAKLKVGGGGAGVGWGALAHGPPLPLSRVGTCGGPTPQPAARHPANTQAFINRDDLDFAAATDLPAVQEWDLLENAGGQVEYPTQ